jgi:hypothetical protein
MNPTTRAWLVGRLACTAVPLVILVAMGVAYGAVAPLWAGGSTDPSYEYLLNSLLAAELRVPVKTDHPGITLEVLGAVALRLRHAFSGSALPLRDHVLSEPEAFLAATVFALLLVVAVCSAFLGWTVWRLTGRSWLAALAQAAPFVCFEVPRSLVQVMSEPLLVAAATALAGLALLGLLPDSHEKSRRLEAAMGVVLGLGVATKVVFLPAAILPTAAARSRGGRVRILLWAVLSLAACLLVIAPRLPVTVLWMWRLFAHSGYHGSGAATVIDPSRYAAGIARLLGAELPLHAVFLASIAVCLWPRAPQAFPSSARRLALGLLGVWAVTLAAAAKQPQAHYLVTTAGLLPVLVVLALWRLQLSQRGRAVVAARAALVLLLAAGIARTVNTGSWLIGVRTEAEIGARTVAAAERGSGVLQGHRVSTVPAALAAGNEWTGLAWSADLRRLYPDFLAFDCEGLHAFGEEAIPREARAHVRDDGTALMRDSAWMRLDECPWTAALPRKTIASAGRDSLHEAQLLPPPPGADTGPWIGGMLIVAGMEGGAGPQRWATSRRTILAFLHEGGPLTLEVSAGHALSGEQTISIVANGVRVDERSVPRLPASGHFTVPIEARPGWNEIEIVYTAGAPAALRVETPLLGFKRRARSPVTPAVLFSTLRLLGPG